MVRVMDSVARNKNSAKKKKKKQQQRSRHKQVRALGFVRASAPGCHVADSGTPPAWVLGCEVFDPEDYGARCVPAAPGDRCTSRAHSQYVVQGWRAPATPPT